MVKQWKPVKIQNAPSNAAFVIFFDDINNASNFGAEISLLFTKALRYKMKVADITKWLDKAKGVCLWGTRKERQKIMKTVLQARH